MVFEKYDEKIIEQKTYQEYTEIYSKKWDDLETSIPKRREELQAVLTASASRNEWVCLFKKNDHVYFSYPDTPDKIIIK